MIDDKYSRENLGAGEHGPETAETFGAPRMVTVRMFEREYQIKSTQPELVELLAAEINREAKKLREMDPARMGPGHFDWPVQVAFRMALSRFNTQEEYNTLKAQVDMESDRMAEMLSSGLLNMDLEDIDK